VVILGVPVDDVTMDDAIHEIVGFVRVGRQTGSWHQVTTVNLDFVSNAVTDVDLLKLLQRAALNIPDGMPIVWGAKALGSPLRARVTGVNLVDSLARRAAAGDITMYLFGAAPGVAEEAARRLRVRHPGATVMHGTSGPHFSNVEDMDPALLVEIRRARPDVLCVALGNPKQEWWIEHYGPELDVPVLIGVGGTFDLIVGRRRRAPDWLQRSGLEWLARTVQEPVRLGPRYLRDAIVCFPRFAAQLWQQRRRSAAKRWRPAVIELTEPGIVNICAGPSLDLRRDVGLRQLHFTDTTKVRVDLAAVEAADAGTIGALVSLARAARGVLRVDQLRSELRRALAQAGVLEMVLAGVEDHVARLTRDRAAARRPSP
jgi:N-acetylglucosaminyldiphosphoundecaprenol N-acetyl-beta-D-mannosaminyltransferase